MKRGWEIANQMLVFKGYIELRLSLHWFWCPKGFSAVYEIQQQEYLGTASS